MLRRGPLAGIRVLDLSQLGPGPFATMMFADFGATVLSIVRPGGTGPDPSDGLARGKQRIMVDLRTDEGVALVRQLAAAADILVESFRPGVLERLGIGPDILMAENPRLICVRLTGWGQDGPAASRAGHDINYLARSGALGIIGTDHPVAPPALLGDLANGSYLAVIGALLALRDRDRTGHGQIVDAAIVDGASYMLTPLIAEAAADPQSGRLGDHLLSGQAPFYGVYRCADGKWFSTGAIEPQFYAAFLRVLGIDDADPSPAAQFDRARWPALREQVRQCMLQRTRDEWATLFDAADACGAPVLGFDELAGDPHLAARETVTADDSGIHAAVAPRLSSHPLATGASPLSLEASLAEFGIDEARVRTLVEEGIANLIGQEDEGSRDA